MLCKKCGAGIPDDSLFCFKCGTNIKGQSEDDLNSDNKENTSDNNEDKSVCFSIAGHSVSFNSDVIEVGKLRSLFSERAWRKKEQFITFYEEDVKSFEEIYSKALPRIVDDILDSVKFGVSVLIKYGVEDVDYNILLNDASDDIDPAYILDTYIEAADWISEKADELCRNRQLQRLSRGQWRGGGFGLGGAIKGALTAGALNMTAGAFHSVGDSLTNARDKARIKELERTVYEDPDNIPRLSNAINQCCFSVFYAVWGFIEDVPYVDFDTERCDAKLTNYLNQYQHGEIPKGKLVEQLCQCINTYPFDTTYYTEIYKLCNEAKELQEMATYFGVGNQFKSRQTLFDKKKLSEIEKLPSSSIYEIDSKIELLYALEKCNNDIGISSIVDTLKKKKQNMLYEEEQWLMN